MSVNQEGTGVGLAEAIGRVREELETAIAEGAQSDVAFRAGPVELEFSLEFGKTGGADAGVRVWVVSIGAKGEITSKSANRLTVSLQPVDRGTLEDKLIGSESAH